MHKRRRWTTDDDILALNLYFMNARRPDAGMPGVERTAQFIGASPSSLAARMQNFRRLHFGGAGGVARLSEKVWAEYCRDDRWMLQRLKRPPPPEFGEICKDIERLRRDADDIFRRAAPITASRREARRAAMNVLYAARAQNISAADALSLLQKAPSSARDKSALADPLPRAIAATADECEKEIEERIAAAADRAPERISAVEIAVLRAAVAELLSHPRVERGIVIDEAVEIAKQFGAEGGYKIVNGALDKIAARLQNDRARE